MSMIFRWQSHSSWTWRTNDVGVYDGSLLSHKCIDSMLFFLYLIVFYIRVIGDNLPQLLQHHKTIGPCRKIANIQRLNDVNSTTKPSPSTIIQLNFVQLICMLKSSFSIRTKQIGFIFHFLILFPSHTHTHSRIHAIYNLYSTVYRLGYFAIVDGVAVILSLRRIKL